MPMVEVCRDIPGKRYVLGMVKRNPPESRVAPTGKALSVPRTVSVLLHISVPSIAPEHSESVLLGMESKLPGLLPVPEEPAVQQSAPFF